MNLNDKIYIAGHLGMVGSAIKSNLLQKGYKNLVVRNKKELDLSIQQDVNDFLEKERPKYIVLAAAKVGGIVANNNYPADFIYENLMIETNLIHGAFSFEIKNLLFLGSSCIYPKNCDQPIKEESLLEGGLEPTNEPYAISKIAGIKLCESYNRQYGCNFRSIMPTNLYGQNDNFHLKNSHVIPALIRKFHEAKVDKSDYVTVWGSGNQRRDFLHVNDLAEAAVHIMQLDQSKLDKEIKPMLSHVNVGSGLEISIKECARIIKKIVGYNGDIIFDNEMPDGTNRKLLSINKIKRLGWSPTISFNEGVQKTYNWFLTNKNKEV